MADGDAGTRAPPGGAPRLHDDAAPVRGDGAERNGTSGVAPDRRACLFFLCWFGTTTLSRRANGRPVLVTRTATRDATASGWASATQGRCTGGPRPPPRGVVYGVRARWVASRAAVPSAQRPTRGTSVGDPPLGHALGTRPRTVRPAPLPLPRPRAPSHSLSTGLWGARAVPLRIAAAVPAPKYHSTGDPGGALATRAVSPSPPSVPPSPVVTPPPDHCTSRTVGQAPHGACTPVSTATPHGRRPTWSTRQWQPSAALSNACTAAWRPHRPLRGRGGPCATEGRGEHPHCPAGDGHHTPGCCRASQHGGQPGRLEDGRPEGHTKRGKRRDGKKKDGATCFPWSQRNGNRHKNGTASGALRSGAAAREERKKKNSTQSEERSNLAQHNYKQKTVTSATQTRTQRSRNERMNRPHKKSGQGWRRRR